MRLVRTRLLGALGIAAALLFAPTTASATSPVTLGAGYVHDEADVLSPAEEDAAQQRLEQLRNDSDAEMWVVYVDEFTDPSDSAEWANETADDNGLGADQYLLAISTDGRQLFLSPPFDGGLGEAKLVAIEEAAGAALQSDDWAGAVDAAADEFTEQAKPDFTFLFVLIGLAILVVVVLVVLRLAARAKKRRAEEEARAELAAEVSDVDKRASALMVQMDDDLRTAEQELGFAVAQFGDEAVGDYAAALSDARTALDRSFAIQQQLEDDAPEALERQREMLGEIVSLLERADQDLDDKAEGFEKLRELDENAPQVLEQLAAKRASAADAPERIAAEIARLRETYASPALDDVDGNDEQAATRLAFVDTALDEARAHLDAGDSGEAALDLRDAERALGQVDELVGAVTVLSGSFAESEAWASEMIAELESDIRRAQTMPDPDGRIAQAVAATTGLIDNARTNLQSSARTPLVISEALDQANDRIDGVLASARAAEEARVRQQQKLDHAIRQAQSHLSTAESYISTRRGGVGASARTQAAQARTALDKAIAVQTTDADRAITQAQQAARLAQNAAQSARSDVQRYERSGYGGYSGGYGRRRTSGIGDDIVGGVIGGLIGGALSGGSRRGSGWGSSSRRGGLSGLGGFGGASRSGGGRRGGRSRSSGGRRGGGRRF
ncbi:YgcG family protein [Microbacterium sp. G2-8]|uniref:TPM domain-containing protein n=1 Tax=Microbacterium sp. G2-8 TaxID=2842454 RepID=UPI001C8AE55C|nr:TPM domain-containing protein [Microbacterium sp. G2-8]